MDKGLFTGLMEIDMKDNEKIISEAVKVFFIEIMEIFIMVIGKMMK